MNTVVCIGDSLTYGKNWANGSDLSMTFNVRLAQKYPEIAFVNLGVNSDTSTGVNTRKANADVYNPFRVIVWIGTNDVSAGTSAATIESNLQSIYTYYKVTKGYEVWAMTITPTDSDDGAKNTVRNTVNAWIKNTAIDIDRIIDDWAVIADPNDTTQRFATYADPNSENHFNDAGLAAIMTLFP